MTNKFADYQLDGGKQEAASSKGGVTNSILSILYKNNSTNFNYKNQQYQPYQLPNRNQITSNIKSQRGQKESDVHFMKFSFDQIYSFTNYQTFSSNFQQSLSSSGQIQSIKDGNLLLVILIISTFQGFFQQVQHLIYIFEKYECIQSTVPNYFKDIKAFTNFIYLLSTKLGTRTDQQNAKLGEVRHVTSPATINPKACFNTGRINMHSVISSDEVDMGTDNQNDQVNYDTARESQNNQEDVLFASPMSIINREVDEIVDNATEHDNKIMSADFFNGDNKINTQRYLLSQRSNLLDGPGTSRSSRFFVGHQKNEWSNGKYNIRDNYLIQSQRLRSQGTPMLISDKKMKILANNIELSNFRSQFISKLIKGNSCVKPRSASSGTSGYGLPFQKHDTLLNLNRQQSSINQIERGKSSIGIFLRPQTPDDQNNQSLNELDYMEDSKFELPVSPMNKNFDLMRQLRSSYPLDLNETNRYPEGERPDSSKLVDEIKLRTSSLDYVANIRQSANRIVSSTLNSVSNVANQVSNVVAGDGVLNNVESVSKNLINKTKQAMGTVIVQPINRSVQFVDQNIVDQMTRGVQIIMSPRVINEKSHSDDSRDSNGGHGQSILNRSRKRRTKSPISKKIPGHTLIQQLLELKDPSNSNDQTNNNEKIDSILRFFDQQKRQELNIQSSYNSSESNSDSSCQSHPSGYSSNQTNNFYDRQKKKTMAKMTKVFRQPTKKVPHHDECLMMNNSNMDQSHLNQTNNHCDEQKMFFQQMNKYKQFNQNNNSDENLAKHEIAELINQVQETPIFGKKFNYCLDPSIQDFKLFRCQITISNDENSLVIYNLRPISKKIDRDCKPNSPNHKNKHSNKMINGKSQCQNKKHHVGGIMRKPTISELIQNREPKKRMQRKKSQNQNIIGSHIQNSGSQLMNNSTPQGGGLIRRLTSNFSIKSANGDEDHDDDEIESVKQLEENQQTQKQLYQRVKSSASCSFDEIQAIVFGGLNSRFWVFRKHINSFKLQKQDSLELKENMPFYAWQCISIQLKKRTIDLVIESEKEMMDFIKILVFKLDMLDGFTGSSMPLQKRIYSLLYKREYKNLLKTQPKQKKIDVDSEKIWDKVRTQVYRKAVLKYKILVIRSKISYEAFLKKMTVPELFYDQITKTYSQFYETHIEYPPYLIQKFSLLLSGDLRSVFTRLIEFEIEHKKFMLKKNGQSDDIMKAIMETQKTLFAIKKRDKLIVKDKMSKQIRNIFGILEASGRIQPKKRMQQHMIDIFQDTQVGGYNMYEQMSKDDASHYRRDRGILESQLRKINIILQMGNLKGTFYTRTLLKKIELVKQLFVLDLEQDQEVFIPIDLSQNNLPMNFQFYDPLINIIWQYISPDKEQYFSLKTQYNIDIAINQNWKLKLVNILGSDKMTNKHDFLNDQMYLNLDHTNSQHSKSLQKSDYVQIEHRTRGIKNDLKFMLHQERQKHVQSGNMQNANKTGENLFKNMPLIIRYCNNKEVQKKRSKFLKFKQTYLVKHHNIKNQGQKLRTLGAVTQFIEENLDSFYENKEEIRQNLTQKGYKRSLTCAKKKCCSGLDVPQIQTKTYESITHQRITYRKQQQLKKKFQEELIDVAHILLDKKRLKQRMKFYHSVRSYCSPQMLYQTKNQFLNNNIEATQEYFSNSHNLQNPNRAINTIRKQVDDINQRIQQSQQLKKIIKSRSSSFKQISHQSFE